MSLGLASLEKPLELSCDRYRQTDPWSLAFTVTDKQSKGRWGSAHPPGRRVSGPGVARKSPWSLAVTVTENRTKGRWGSAHPTRETCLWAWRRSKKPLELSCDRYREPDQGALGQCPPRQGDLPLTDPPPGSRSNPEPTQGRGAVPGLPRRLRHPGCLAQAPVFDLVVFEPKFIQGPLPHGRAERAALVGKAGRGPEATVPAAGDPKTLSRWHLKTASLTDRPPARGRDRSRSRERRALLGKATDEEGVGSSTLARNETPRPSDSKLGTQVDPDGPYPTPPPRVDNPPGPETSRAPIQRRLPRVDTPPGAGDRHPCFRHPHPPLTPLLPDSEASHRPPLLRGHLRRTTPTCSPAEPGTPTLKPGLLTQPTAPSGEPGHWSPWERFTAGHPGKSLPLVTPGEIYRWSPRIDLGFGRFALGLPGFLGGLCEPDLQNHDSGLRGGTAHTHSTRLREPGPRAEGGDSLTPTLPASGNQDLGQRGATLLHPLYPPQGTRTSGRGGHSPAPPLPASGNQDLGQRGPLSCTPSTRLGEPGPRAEGGHRAHPLLLSSPVASPPRAPPDLQEGPLPHPPFEPGHPTLKPGVPGGLCEPDPLNHDSGPRGGTAHTPSARLREPDARSEGAALTHPLRHWFPPYRLRFFFRPAIRPGHWYPRDTAGGRTEAARVGLLLGRQKIGSREDFQWIAASASQERGGARSAAPRSSHEWLSAPAGPGGSTGYPRPIRAPRRCGIVTSRRDSDLEAFSHNPTDGSRTSGSSAKHTHKCLNLRFLSY
ncbi:hypothetical protein G5714_024695 [Onychostoma macrolepis]|uniref:Uncharacterized protein n=1 Tax=Onychostoma macrolepis TaxID=369639 RepID=A0A7J6BI98_9TELE|nr:hypothetical protein G5714_024695 [Onychostoma macrolepis]